jgi:hydroxyacylglutathione hydrolase
VELIEANITLIRNRIFPSNSYLVGSQIDDSCIVIDPGMDVDSVMAGIEESKLRPVAVFSTHGHFDHIGSAASIQSAYGIPFYLHEADVKMSQSANFFLQLAKLPQPIITPRPDVIIDGREGIIDVGKFLVEYYNYPGHSSGSCIFKFGNNLFTGDILYKNGLYPETVPKEDKKLLKESILSIFTKFADECLILPGHGGPELLGNIKRNNLELAKFIAN